MICDIRKIAANLQFCPKPESQWIWTQPGETRRCRNGAVCAEADHSLWISLFHAHDACCREVFFEVGGKVGEALFIKCVCVCVAPWEVTFQKWSGHSEWCPFLERCIQEMSWFLGFFPSSWSLIIWTRVVLPTLPSCAKDVSKVGNCIVMWPFNGWARENTRSTRIHSKPNLTWPPRQQKHQKKIRDSYWFFTLQLTSQWKIFKTVVLTLSYFESTPPPYFTVDKQSTVPHLYEGAVYPSFTFYCYRLGQLDLKSPPSFWMFTL